ncbi:hypothetical protein DFP72DRAFT_446944 [Ephemerocybe angulata]|uniref:Uncharacterized protein n=1 Tax=Ephemerocybe angulata TaxID=980116 RepID=A0A8H6HSW4_9AGAR|nr:hypothetical protein DFP72DRAFT_446944 [Tulosesus angulatus]
MTSKTPCLLRLCLEAQYARHRSSRSPSPTIALGNVHNVVFIHWVPSIRRRHCRRCHRPWVQRWLNGVLGPSFVMSLALVLHHQQLPSVHIAIWMGVREWLDREPQSAWQLHHTTRLAILTATYPAEPLLLHVQLESLGASTMTCSPRQLPPTQYSSGTGTLLAHSTSPLPSKPSPPSSSHPSICGRRSAGQ